MRVPEETHELTRSGTPFRRVENLVQVRDWFAWFLHQGPARVAAGPEGARRPLSRRDGARSPVYIRHPMATSPVDTATRARAQELIRAYDARAGSLGRLLGRVTAVDQVGVEERTDALRDALDQEGLEALGARPRDPDDGLDDARGEGHAGQGSGAVRQGDASAARRPVDPGRGGGVRLPGTRRGRAGGAARDAASTSPASRPAFRRARRSARSRCQETRLAVEAGADEIDMVIDRNAFLAGDYQTVFEEIVAVKEAAGAAHLKVILETGELETYDNVRRASVLAMAAGADFIKTSTGKVTPAATLPVTLVMLEAVRDFERQTGREIGIKPAGGIRTAKEAVQYLVVLYETLGPRWMRPDRFRFGASSLLNDVLMQIEKERTGRYQDPDDFTVD